MKATSDIELLVRLDRASPDSAASAARAGAARGGPVRAAAAGHAAAVHPGAGRRARRGPGRGRATRTRSSPPRATSCRGADRPTRVGEQGAAPADPVTPAADPARPPRFDLRPGTPDVSLFPRRTWASALAAVLRDAPDDRFGYPMPQGAPELRAELAAYLGRVRGVVADPDAIVITSGVAQGLSLVTRVLRIGGDADRPGGSRRRADPAPADRRRAGARADPRRRRGPRRRRAGEQRRAGGVRRPRAPVPHRRRAEPGAARAAARLARAGDRGRLRRRVPLRPRAGRRRARARARPGRVPRLTQQDARAGAADGLAGRAAGLADAILREKAHDDNGTPVLEQLALARLLARGEIDRHIRRTRLVYLRRRDALLAALARAARGASVRDRGRTACGARAARPPRRRRGGRSRRAPRHRRDAAHAAPRGGARTRRSSSVTASSPSRPSRPRWPPLAAAIRSTQ